MSVAAFVITAGTAAGVFAVAIFVVVRMVRARKGAWRDMIRPW